MTIAYTPTLLDEPFNPDRDFDTCDITLCTKSGRKAHCGEQAVHAAVDVDGRIRLLCKSHVELYFGGM